MDRTKRVILKESTKVLDRIRMYKIYLMCSFERTVYSFIFLDSSMVEHSAVNRVVVGSSPTRGAVRIIMIVKQVGRVVLLVQY